MSEHDAPIPPPDDAQEQHLGFGSGGVPWYLLLLYIGFLTFFTWYALRFQLPDYLEQGPGRGGEPASASESR